MQAAFNPRGRLQYLTNVIHLSYTGHNIALQSQQQIQRTPSLRKVILWDLRRRGAFRGNTTLWVHVWVYVFTRYMHIPDSTLRLTLCSCYLRYNGVTPFVDHQHTAR